MDRLSENHRVAPRNRAEAIDFTRSQPTRVERRDDGEARGSERPEPFAQHLEDQKVAHEQQTSAEESGETQAAPDGRGRVENASDQSSEPPVEADVAVQAPALEALPAPQIEGTAVEVLQSSPLTPPAHLAPALPVVAAAMQPASVVNPFGQAPRIPGEATAAEIESSTAKLGAPPADTGANQVQNSTPKPETPARALEIEAPREPQAARSAHEVERAAEILRQIRVQLTPALSEARIQLHPAELGRVSIHLKIEEGRMKSVVRAEKTETLQAIQTHLPELRAALRQHGIDAQEFQLLLGFENRPRRDTDDDPASSHTRRLATESPALERLPALHVAVTKTGVDLYA